MNSVDVRHASPAPAPMRNGRVVGAAVLWIAAVVATFAGQFAAQAAWRSRDAYSWARNDISDLGFATCGRHSADGRLVCSPHHVLANTGFAAYGVLLVVGVIVLAPIWRRSISGSAAALLLAATGAGSAVVGAAPADTRPDAHHLAAGVVFICGNLAMITFAPTLRRLGAVRTAWLGVVLGIVGLACVPLFLSDTHLGIGRGGIERVVVWSLDLWNIVVAAALIRSHSAAR